MAQIFAWAINFCTEIILKRSTKDTKIGYCLCIYKYRSNFIVKCAKKSYTSKLY